MLDAKTRTEIIRLIKKEVVPAIGCTEPVAVALCVAKATELLGAVPGKINVKLSANILKNAMGVGIPGTGMIGLPIAIALGALVGKSEYQLEVLKNVDASAVERGLMFLNEGRINISLKEKAPSNLFIDVTACHGSESSRAVIAYGHTNFILLSKGDTVILNSAENDSEKQQDSAPDHELNLKTVYEFATESPISELKFILEAKRLNENAAAIALENNYGHSLGKIIQASDNALFGNSILKNIISRTSCACDARMGGAPVAVMSNSGSGNQGICATMPVVSYAEDTGASEENLVRALVLSHLTSIYIKQSLGRLSALCGCVVASTGASSGITYLMGGKYPQICAAVKNMIANLTGMICDGAKPACSLKISSGVSTALMSAMLAMNGKCVSDSEGIICNDVDRSIHNLTSIGREAMRETDRLVLNIMTSK